MLLRLVLVLVSLLSIVTVGQARTQASTLRPGASGGPVVQGAAQVTPPAVDNLKNDVLENKPTSGILTTIFTENVSGRTTRGILIDGGSGGSRLHIYEWAPRIFESVPPPISFPTTNEQYTARMGGGVQNCWLPGQTKEELKAAVMLHFQPMLDFARLQLSTIEDERIPHIPIWFKATGGAREMTPESREALLGMIRDLFEDKKFNPFYFKREMARVISGEEEAVFSWACMNFLKGNLIPASQGMGQVTHGHANGSFGTLDLGGSSTQIAFFLPSEDYMEGLYKLQIGGQKHWNVYTKSFLEFGINSSRKRMFRLLAENAVSAVVIAHNQMDKKTLKKFHYEVPEDEVDADMNIKEWENFDGTGTGTGTDESTMVAVKGRGRGVLPGKSRDLTVSNPCFHQGYSEDVYNLILDESNPQASTVNITVNGPVTQEKGPRVQLTRCMQALKPLMEKDANAYCNVVYHGECSIGGAYQPALPKGNYRHFFATSSYELPWTFLRLPENVTLEFFAERAGEVCEMTLNETLAYIDKWNLAAVDAKLGALNQYFCFMASYTLVLLQDGYGFTPQDTITAIDKINGFTTGWPLGAILHEINNLPWELQYDKPISPWGKYLLSLFVGVLIGGAIAFRVTSELNVKMDNISTSSSNRHNHNDNNRARSRSSSHTSMHSPGTGAGGSGGISSKNIEMGIASSIDNNSKSNNSNGEQGQGGSWKDRISQLNPFTSSMTGYEPISDEKDQIKA